MTEPKDAFPGIVAVIRRTKGEDRDNEIHGPTAAARSCRKRVNSISSSKRGDPPEKQPFGSAEILDAAPWRG